MDYVSLHTRFANTELADMASDVPRLHKKLGEWCVKIGLRVDNDDHAKLVAERNNVAWAWAHLQNQMAKDGIGFREWMIYQNRRTAYEMRAHWYHRLYAKKFEEQ